jgi:hypothetical protein
MIQPRQILSVGGCLFIGACSIGAESLETRARLIAPGMSRVQVETILGPPLSRQFNGRMEVWQYCQPVRDLREEDNLVLVWINNGSVAGVQSVSEAPRATVCLSAYEPVNWQLAPDAIVGIRSR